LREGMLLRLIRGERNRGEHARAGRASEWRRFRPWTAAPGLPLQA
jgi:hypothetical protein